MENTIENKSKLFAQHLGQEVAHELKNITPKKENFPMKLNSIASDKICVTDIGIDFSFWLFLETAILILKPLKKITREDAIEVAKIIKPEWKIEDAIGEKWQESFISQIDGNKSIIYPKRAFHVLDFLRSKGYAVDFMGLSVEDQIKYGWIKLIE